MDRKAFIVLLVSFLLLMLWYPLTNRLFPPLPLPEGSTNRITEASRAVGNTTNTATPALEASAPALSQAAGPVRSLPRSETPEKIVTVENENARYAFTSHGGGLKVTELKKFKATVDCNSKRRAGQNNLVTLNAPAPLPVLTLLGGPDIEGDGEFQLTQTAAGVRAEKSFTNGLRLIKEFQLSTNYLVKATVRWENQSTQPVTLPVQEWVIGTATPIGQRDESLYLGFQWYNGERSENLGEATFSNRRFIFFSGEPRTEYTGGASNVFWASVHNQFFTLIAVPNEPAPRLVARRILLPPPTPEELAADSKALALPYGFQAGFLYPSATLAPHQSIERKFDLYAGPKEYNTLARLGHNLDLVMKFGFWGFFAKALLLSMNGLNKLGLAYGLAIVVITVIIKVLFWPLTTASTRSMKRMAALQPQMKAIQEKYKEDPRKMNQKLMEFMKENRVSPLGGCLPMMLQIPVFIGFYTMLQSAIELRGARFLWACDLSRPDTIWVIPGLNFPLNPMPLLMGATMFWQARQTPPSPGMDPVQQKIMKYMPLMFMVFLYNYSAGLALYWTVQNLLTIAQMKLTKSIDPEAKSVSQFPVRAAKAPAPKKK